MNKLLLFTLSILIISCKKIIVESETKVSDNKKSITEAFNSIYPNGIYVKNGAKNYKLSPNLNLNFKKTDNVYEYEEICLSEKDMMNIEGTFSFLRRTNLYTQEEEFVLHFSESMKKNKKKDLNIFLHKNPLDSGFTSIFTLKGEILEKFVYLPNNKFRRIKESVSDTYGNSARMQCILVPSLHYNIVVEGTVDNTYITYVPYYLYTEICYDNEQAGGNTTAGTTWGGGSGGSTPTSPVIFQNQTIPTLPEFTPADSTQNIDLSDTLSCFTYNNTSNYQVAICVKQPVPGSSDPIGGLSLNNQSLLNFGSVGHTFLSLTQINANGKAIRRVIGFYPSNMIVTPLNPSCPGVINSNNGTVYDVAVTWSVSSTSFQSLVQIIQNANNLTYNLNSFNCTTFAVTSLNQIGLNIPMSTSYIPSNTPGIPAFFGMNPGQTGQDLRNYNGNYFLKCLEQRQCGKYFDSGTCK